jgi:hypothetical protein
MVPSMSKMTARGEKRIGTPDYLRREPGLYNSGITTKTHLLVAAFAAAVLYGSTYQQFRFFTLDEPGGAADALHYVQMARGERPVEADLRHYRWLTPAAARVVKPLAVAIVDTEIPAIQLAFYIVNFTFSLIAMLALFQLLQALHFSLPISLLGICVYGASRVTVLVTATPLVDAVYFCAISIITWLTLARRPVALALLMPVLVLTKITILPFLALPLLTELRWNRVIWAGLAASAVTFAAVRELVNVYYLGGQNLSETAGIIEHVVGIGQTLARAFTWSGLHDVQSAFSLLWLFSIGGAWINARHHYHDVPPFLVAMLPIAALLAVLSGNFGRMLFAAFPVVIALALIPIEHAARGLSREQP